MFFSDEEIAAQIPFPLWGGSGWGFVPRGESEKEESSFSEEKEARRLLFWCLRNDPGPLRTGEGDAGKLGLAA